MMAMDLYCPNCGEYLGKDTENPRYAFCSNCCERNIDNPRGITEEEENRMLAQQAKEEEQMGLPWNPAKEIFGS